MSRLFLDSNILIAITNRKLTQLDPKMESVVSSAENIRFVSAASLWKIAIKTRLGKLDPMLPLDRLPGYLRRLVSTFSLSIIATP